jgi:hypothetical protein
MNAVILMICIVGIVNISACAHIDFDGKGLTYYDPKPYLFVSTTQECVSTATVVMIPEIKKVMQFKSGYGSAELSASLTNGMVSSVGQKTDTKIPETISAIASLGTAATGFKTAEVGKKVVCKPTATLYHLDSGVPALDKSLSFPVTKEIVDVGKPDK